MVWLRRFLLAAALAAVVALLLTLVIEQSLAIAVGFAGVMMGAVLAFAKRREMEGAGDAASGGEPDERPRASGGDGASSRSGN
jgi:hypothetical protein